jgi:hypothetical protein
LQALDKGTLALFLLENLLAAPPSSVLKFPEESIRLIPQLPIVRASDRGCAAGPLQLPHMAVGLRSGFIPCAAKRLPNRPRSMSRMELAPIISIGSVMNKYMY